MTNYTLIYNTDSSGVYAYNTTISGITFNVTLNYTCNNTQIIISYNVLPANYQIKYMSYQYYYINNDNTITTTVDSGVDAFTISVFNLPANFNISNSSKLYFNIRNLSFSSVTTGVAYSNSVNSSDYIICTYYIILTTDKPTNLTISDISGGGVTFSWNHVTTRKYEIVHITFSINSTNLTITDINYPLSNPSVNKQIIIKNTDVINLKLNYTNPRGNGPVTNTLIYTYYITPQTFPTVTFTNTQTGATLRWNDNSYFTSITITNTGATGTTAVNLSGINPTITSYASGTLPNTNRNTFFIPKLKLTSGSLYDLSFNYVNGDLSGASFHIQFTPSYTFKDFYITNQTTLVDTTSITQKNLYLPPVLESAGAILNIKDITGNAFESNITIYPYPGESAKIDGSATIVININLGYLILSSDGENWWCFSQSNPTINLSQVFATYDTITEPTGTYVKTASPNTQIHRVMLTPANYMVILPPPDNTIHIVIGANAPPQTSVYLFYIKSANGEKIHKANYISLRSDTSTATKHLAVILFGDSASNEWHILGGMFTVDTATYSPTITNTKIKINETQITYFNFQAGGSQPTNHINISLEMPIPKNVATILYFKNKSSTSKEAVTIFTPSSGTFNGNTNYFYKYTGMWGGAIIVALNDAGTITYYMIGNQL